MGVTESPFWAIVCGKAMASTVPSRPPVAAAEPRPSRRVRPANEDLADIQAGLADVAAGRTVDLTPAELAEWERTGELPAAVEARLAAFD